MLMGVKGEPRYDEPGAQQTINGKVWTLARYDLAAWVPTDDPDEADRRLREYVEQKMGAVENMDLAATVEKGEFLDG